MEYLVIDPDEVSDPGLRADLLDTWIAATDAGGGAGRLLMEGLRQSAEGLGLEQLQLTIRDGHSLEKFYGKLGYRIVGSHPRAVRVALDDYRDEIMLVRDL